VVNHFQSNKTYSTEEIKTVMQKFSIEAGIEIRKSKEVMTLGCILEIKETTKIEQNKKITAVKIL
ncbi:MAG: hypothetical protein AABY22_14475, partial [Nanoarchaeota archaeon]